MSALDKLLKRNTPENHVPADVKRICAMPTKVEPTEQLIEELSDFFLTPYVRNLGISLRPKQADAIVQFMATKGLFAPIGAGGGKTLVSLLLAHIGHSDLRLRKIMLIVPSALVSKLVDLELAEYRKWADFSFPVHVIAGRPTKTRKQIALSNRPGLYIYSYSMLSQPDAHEILSAVAPDMLILDEAHMVSNYKAARTHRLMTDYVDKAHPIFCAMSGTMTRKKLMDYFSLVRASLKGNSFLPSSHSLVSDWGAVIDAGSQCMDYVPRPAMSGLDHVYKWANRQFPGQITDPVDRASGLRKAFALRMKTTPGVVSSDDIDCEASLMFHNRPIYKKKEDVEDLPEYQHLTELIDQVQEAKTTPGGEPIDHAIHTYKWMTELTMGFYNELYWPDIETVARRRDITATTAARLLEYSREHLSATQEYQKALRDWFKDNRMPELDTPLLVGNSMYHHGHKYVGAHLYEKWKERRDLNYKYEDHPKHDEFMKLFNGEILDRDSRAIRIWDYKIKAAVDFAEKFIEQAHKKASDGKGLILWYYHDEVGRWLAEMCHERGLEYEHCMAGNRGAAILMDVENSKGKILICSLGSHGTGRNMQYQHTQYYVEWYRSATTAEQAIARQHRLGQEADSVTCVTCHTTEFDQMNFASTLNDVLYQHQAMGTTMRMIMASYEPRPRIFPYHVIRERGIMTTHQPDREMLRKMEVMFI